MIKKRSIKNFIYNIMNKNEIWANAHLIFIDEEIKNDNLFNLIAKFKNHIRMKSNKKFHHNTHSAFFVSKQSNQSNQQSENHSNQINQNQNQNSFFRNRDDFRDRDRKRNDSNVSFQKKQQISECICEEFHFYADCNYINFIKRSIDWTSDSEKIKRVIEIMKNFEFKTRIDIFMKKRQNMIFFNKWKQQNFITSSISDTSESFTFVADNSTNESYYGIFTTAIAFSSFASFNYFLRSSWILDNESDTHICNKIMLHRFRKTRNVSFSEIIIDETRSKIEIIDEIEISINVFEKKIWKILFIDVCYIFNFMTNIAAQRKFRIKKIYFDDQNMRFRIITDQTLSLIKHIHDYDLLKNNTTIDDSELYDVAIIIKIEKSKTIQYWHEMLTHVNNKIIQHLQTVIKKMKITDSSISMSKTHECKTCAFFKMHKIVFHFHKKEQNFNQSFFWIIYDLISMFKNFNDHEWISHLACSQTDFNLIYTHKIKSETQTMIRHEINLIKIRFDEKMIFFRTDKKKLLNDDFKKFIASSKISYEFSSSDTSIQNDHSEKKIICSL